MSADFFQLGKSTPDELAAMMKAAARKEQNDQLAAIDKLLAEDAATVYSTGAHRPLREAVALLRQLVTHLLDKK